MKKLEEFMLSDCEKRILITILRFGWCESSKIHHISLEIIKKRVIHLCESNFDDIVDKLVNFDFIKSKNYPVLTKEGYKIVSDYYRRTRKLG